jgi:serine/threonine protein kinase
VIALETATSIGTHRLSRNSSLAWPDGSDEQARSTTLSLSPSLLQSASGVEELLAKRPSAAERRLGRFWLVERLGRGCQGDVWKAIQVEPLIESVALKILPRSMARNPKRRAQFRREAERGARLAGPSLLPTYEYGEVDGLIYIAMPLVDGCSLQDVVTYRRNPRSQGTLPRLHPLAFEPDADYVRSIVRLFARVARALADVHDARVAHRDIKPSNILLDRGPNQGVFLCDFGLARDLDIATPAQLRDGAGTPLYMPPERLLRSPADEILCDIYALGATLFEALTLVPPFQVPEDLHCSQWAAFLALAEPARPRALRGGIPAELEAIVVRAMDRDPGRRHASAKQLAEDLEQVLARPSANVRADAPHRPISVPNGIAPAMGAGPSPARGARAIAPAASPAAGR